MNAVAALMWLCAGACIFAAMAQPVMVIFAVAFGVMADSLMNGEPC